YFPVAASLSDVRPAGVKKEPAYRGKPRYTTLRVGNGPRAAYLVALDEPAEGEAKIYVDVNRNGDLTDDGDGAWSQKNERNGSVSYGRNYYTLRASWGMAARETSAGPYGLALYWSAGSDKLMYYRSAARVGSLTLDGKLHKVMLIENDSD